MSGAVAAQLVNAPAGRTNDAVHVGCRDQHSEDVAQPPHQIIAEFPAIVFFDEARQASVPDVSNDHVLRIVRFNRTPVNWQDGEGPKGSGRPRQPGGF